MSVLACIRWGLKVAVPVSLSVFALSFFGDAPSENSILSLPVDHPLFGGNTNTHIDSRFFNREIAGVQRVRLDSVRATLAATISACKAMDFPVFLEAATLLGHVRHEGDVVPFDQDGDVAFYVPECLARFSQPGSLAQEIRKFLPGRFEVAKAECVCQEDCEGEDGRVLGRVVDRTTGFFVDFFGYDDLAFEELEPWQRAHSAEWLYRTNDWAGKLRHPRNVIFPLRSAESSLAKDLQVLVPNDAIKFLQFEYGMVLSVPIVPWKLLSYTDTSLPTHILTIVSSFMTGEYFHVAVALLSVLAFGGGIRALACLYLLLVSTFSSRTPRVLLLLQWALVLNDVAPTVLQVAELLSEVFNVGNRNLNPTRVFTICVGNLFCADF